ncbi:MAG: NAD(P)/FAD-dependent oxidoreductase [Planctomycetota bacterium]
MSSQPEVIIVGAGPAGTTAAAVLAMHRRRVVVLDKAAFPRYHIGESLIPYTWFTLKRIGMLEKLEKSHFTKKYSICFISQTGKQSQPFFFDSHFDHPATQTWQVRRSEFDQMLRDNAREKGAEIRHGIQAERLIMEQNRVVGVAGKDESGKPFELRAPIVIDASGRDCLAVNQFGWRVWDKPLDRFAIWTYWKGAVRDPGRAGGATTVAYVPNKGWFWYIPLHDDIMSVGVVAKKEYLFRDTQDLATIYQREVNENVWLMEHLKPATQCDGMHVTNEYSYRSRHCATDGLVLAGDAFNFLDPVFSSGAFFALWSGERAGDAVHAALSANNTSAEAFSTYGKTYCTGVEAMRKLVYGFYDENTNYGQFIRQHPDLKADLTDCIIGAVEKDFRPLFDAFRNFATIPPDLDFGGPLVPQRDQASASTKQSP